MADEEAPMVTGNESVNLDVAALAEQVQTTDIVASRWAFVRCSGRTTRRAPQRRLPAGLC